MKKQKQAPKTEEQIVAEMARKKEVARLKVIAKDKIVPLLVDNTRSISEAQMIVSDISNTIETYLYQMTRKMKLAKLDMVSKMTASPQAVLYTRLISFINKEKIEDAVMLLNGIRDGIDNAMKLKAIQEPFSTVVKDLFDDKETA